MWKRDEHEELSCWNLGNRTSPARAPLPPDDAARLVPGGPDELRRFGAAVVLKRTGSWAGGKAVLLDRQPNSERTDFRHRLAAHAVVLHLEGANARTVFRYDGGSQTAGGSTLGRVTFIPGSHEFEGWSDYPTRIRHIVLLLDPKMIDAEVSDAGGGEAPELPFYFDLNDGVIASRMRALQVELDNPGPLGRLCIDSLSCEIAIRLVRHHTARPEQQHRGGLSPRRLRLVKDYIEANLPNDVTLSDMAAIAGVSAAHFCRAFHKSAGVSSHQYIVRRRIELAKGLLADSKMPIAEVALAAGFGNQSHLTKHFRCMVGTTPRRFRNDA
jgi:AraC family transcriptional regulator